MTNSASRSIPTRELRDLTAAQNLFQREGWTDGLPVIPPTVELVEEFIALARLDPDRVLIEVPEQGRVATVRNVTVNAVAAGCRPEYLPVVVRAVEAMAAKQYNIHSTTVSGATAPLVIVSGPAVQLLGINSRFSVFGAGHVANATIGRAIRLVSQNLCGGLPVIVDKATMGHPGKYSYCIGESPDGPWGPHHSELGFDVDASTVTVFAGEGPIFARNDWAAEAEPILSTIADAMKISHFTGGSFVVVLGPLHAARLFEAGMNRSSICMELWERSKRTVTELKGAGRIPGPVEVGDELRVRHSVDRPEDIVLVVAGGDLYGYSAVVPPWVGGHESKPVTVELGSAELNACRVILEEK